MVKEKYAKLKGSSMIEVILALAICTISIYLSVFMFVRIQNKDMSFGRTKALHLAETSLKQTIRGKQFWDEAWEVNLFEIRRTVKRNEIFNDCIEIKILIRKNDQQLVELKQLAIE